MSIEAMNWVMVYAPEDGWDFQVLLALANYAWPDGAHAHPSVATVQGMCRCSESTVHRALKNLVNCGAIELVENNGAQRGPNEYRILRLESDMEPSSWYLATNGGAVATNRGVKQGGCHPDTPRLTPDTRLGLVLDSQKNEKESRVSNDDSRVSKEGASNSGLLGDVELVYAHYVSVFDANHERVPEALRSQATRKKIREALLSVTTDVCLRAIDGAWRHYGTFKTIDQIFTKGPNAELTLGDRIQWLADQSGGEAAIGSGRSRAGVRRVSSDGRVVFEADSRQDVIGRRLRTIYPDVDSTEFRAAVLELWEMGYRTVVNETMRQPVFFMERGDG